MAFFDYTGIIGRGIGTAIGMWFGGPAGAAVGGAAGEMEGGKIGAVGKGDADWSSLLSPGPAPPAAPPAQLGPLAQSSLSTSAMEGEYLASGGMPESTSNFKMADDKGFSILQDTPGYSDPTGGGTPAAAPTEGGGFNWSSFGKGLQGVGNVLSATAAGLQGDNSYNMRLQEQVQRAADRQRLMEQQEKRDKMDMINQMPKALETLKFMRDNLSEDRKPAAAAQISQYLQETGIKMFTPEVINDFISGESSSLESFGNAFEVVKDWPKVEQQRIAELYQKDPAKAEKVVSQRTLGLAARFAEESQPIPEKYKIALAGEDRKVYEQRVGNVVFGKVKELINRNDINKDIQRPDFEKMIPNADALSDDHYTQLVNMGYKNLKPISSMKKEQEATAGTQRDTQSTISAARLITGRNIDSTKDLTEAERDDVEAYMGATSEVKTQLNILKRENPNKSVAELLKQATQSADQRKVNVSVNIQGQGAQAQVAGRERGYQSVLEQRINRIRQEAEAAAGGRPLDASTQESISQLLNLRAQGSVVMENYDASFLGPVKGTNAAFEGRRRVGSNIGSPLTEKETTFRQALADVQATITYALSGKQINEGEAKRLRSMLPAATDEPQVFSAGMRRFDNEAASIIDNKVKLGKTPRGQLTPGATAPSAAGVVKLKRNPTTGKLEEVRE